MVSIIMPCYNAGKYLAKSVRSVIDQTCKDWELIVVNDGSTDDSLAVASAMTKADKRIRVYSKENGGYVSARLAGLKLISQDCKYLLFYDADDMLHPKMLETLCYSLETNPKAGAAYCDHVAMDENDTINERGIDMPRFVPSTFWVKKLPDSVTYTPFVSIFCWTKMIEPMTMLRKEAYEQTPGWDLDFGKGQGNIGEGVYLFSEIALNWKVIFVDQKLYYYRRHSTQSSAVDITKMRHQAEKVINKWEKRSLAEDDRRKIEAAVNFYRFRLRAYKSKQSLKHQLRYNPEKVPSLLFSITSRYLSSIPYMISYRKFLKQ